MCLALVRLFMMFWTNDGSRQKVIVNVASIGTAWVGLDPETSRVWCYTSVLMSPVSHFWCVLNYRNPFSIKYLKVAIDDAEVLLKGQICRVARLEVRLFVAGKVTRQPSHKFVQYEPYKLKLIRLKAISFWKQCRQRHFVLHRYDVITKML